MEPWGSEMSLVEAVEGHDHTVAADSSSPAEPEAVPAVNDSPDSEDIVSHCKEQFAMVAAEIVAAHRKITNTRACQAEGMQCALVQELDASGKLYHLRLLLQHSVLAVARLRLAGRSVQHDGVVLEQQHMAELYVYLVGLVHER